MSWKDILKYIPLQPMDPQIRAARRHIDQLQAPDSKVIDEQTASEMDVAGNCCEAARNAAVTAANSFLDHPLKDKIFMNVGKNRTPDEVERFLLDIEEANCKTLRRWLREVGKIDKYPNGLPELEPTPARAKYEFMHNPLVVEFRKIYEEWSECDKDVV